MRLRHLAHGCCAIVLPVVLAAAPAFGLSPSMGATVDTGDASALHARGERAAGEVVTVARV